MYLALCPFEVSSWREKVNTTQRGRSPRCISSLVYVYFSVWVEMNSKKDDGSVLNQGWYLCHSDLMRAKVSQKSKYTVLPLKFFWSSIFSNISSMNYMKSWPKSLPVIKNIKTFELQLNQDQRKLYPQISEAKLIPLYQFQGTLVVLHYQFKMAHLLWYTLNEFKDLQAYDKIF